MAANAPEHIVRRHFKAYSLLLFGWITFLRSHGDSVIKHYIRYARELTDWPVEDIQPYV